MFIFTYLAITLAFFTKRCEMTIQRLYTKARTWDFLRIIRFFRSLPENEELTDDEVEELIDNYCRFIAMCAHYREPLAISRQVDPFWHAHVLHTVDYAAFCDKVAGGMLHHYPVVRGVIHEKLRKDYLERTIGMYRLAFGEPDSRFFPSDGNAAICWCSYEIVDVDSQVA